MSEGKQNSEGCQPQKRGYQPTSQKEEIPNKGYQPKPNEDKPVKPPPKKP